MHFNTKKGNGYEKKKENSKTDYGMDASAGSVICTITGKRDGNKGRNGKDE